MPSSKQQNMDHDDTFDTSDQAIADVLNGQAQGQLKAFIERVERVNAAIAEEQEARKEIFLEMKGQGFDVPTAKRVIKIRKMDRAKRQEADAILDTYLLATGDL